MKTNKPKEKIFIKSILYSEWGLKWHRNFDKKLVSLEDKIFICSGKIDLLHYIQKLLDEYNTENNVEKEDTLLVTAEGNHIFRINQRNKNVSYVAEIMYYKVM